jgi:hypothetical protein
VAGYRRVLATQPAVATPRVRAMSRSSTTSGSEVADLPLLITSLPGLTTLKPGTIVFTPELPRTRSGKIMRRLLRDVTEQRTLGDTTTLADPAGVEEIQRRAAAEAAAAEGG